MSKVLRLCVECVYRGGGGGAIGAGTQPPYGCAVHVHARFEVVLAFPLLLVARIHGLAAREDQRAQPESEHSANVVSLERLLP